MNCAPHQGTSAARAVTVVQFLQGQGADPRHLGAVGRSEFDDEEGGHGARVEIRVLPSAAEIAETT